MHTVALVWDTEILGIWFPLWKTLRRERFSLLHSCCAESHPARSACIKAHAHEYIAATCICVAELAAFLHSIHVEERREGGGGRVAPKSVATVEAAVSVSCACFRSAPYTDAIAAAVTHSVK